MTVTYLGSLTIGAALPGVNAALLTAYADLQARVTALAAFAPAPIEFSAQVTLLGQMTANIQTMIALGISPPSISAQIAIVAALVAALEAQLSVILGYTNALGVAGLFLYAYAGRADQLGPGFSATLAAGFPGGTGADATNALLLATTTPACWAAMQQLFKTTP